jgi:phage terminase large subunit GpA-like protein
MKTTYLIVVALHTLAREPQNVLHVMATSDDAEELSIERYTPIVKESRGLNCYLDGSKHQLTRPAIRLNGAVLSFVGAYSPSGLASRPVARLFLDEVDKWPEWSGKEADPIRLARERTRTFWNRKIISASTPTTEDRYIWPQLLVSSNERYWLPCPLCNGWQQLLFRQLKWPEKAKPDEIQADRLAYYECEHCSRQIQDAHKPEMLQAGKWVPESLVVSQDGSTKGEPPSRRHVGYHLWAAYSPWLTFSEVVAEYLRSQGADSAKMNFINSWLAEPWRQTVSEVKDTLLRSRVLPDLWQGNVPQDGKVLVGSVDVQSRAGHTYQYYVIRAWGMEEESWLVRAGVSESWDTLLSILFHSAYRGPGGRQVPLGIVVVDSGYRPDEVYSWCRDTGSVAYKGDIRRQQHLTIKGIEPYLGAGVEIPFAVADPRHFKTKLHRLIRTPGKWHLPADLDDEYFAHMIAEQQVRRLNRRTGKMEIDWQVVVPGKPNHLFSCEFMNLVGAELLCLQNWSPPKKSSEAKPKPSQRRAPPPRRGVFSE